MNVILSGESSKFLVALLTAIAGALPVYFGSAKWEPVVVWAIGSALVYLVPNVPKPAASLPPEHGTIPVTENVPRLPS